MLKNISASLLDATRKVVEDSAKKYQDQQLERINKLTEKAMKPSHSGTAPRNDQERKLAAMAHPKDKITHVDVLHGRGVRKEGFDDMMADVKKRQEKDTEEKGTGRFDKKKISTGTVYTRKASTFDDGGKPADMKKAEKKMKNEEAVEENTDTPGNSYQHQCAVHVKHSKLGEGKTLFSQHAEPDADGNIDWYDVMFEHGIEKKVPTTDLEILVSESHMNHKKAKK